MDIQIRKDQPTVQFTTIEEVLDKELWTFSLRGYGSNCTSGIGFLTDVFQLVHLSEHGRANLRWHPMNPRFSVRTIFTSGILN